MKRNGYILPSPAETVGTRCYRVYVPDDIAHRRAFFGSLYHLSNWNAWARDAEKSGRHAAQAWKDANELTFRDLGLSCDGEVVSEDEMNRVLELLEEMRVNILELEKMNITINNNNGGCCTGDEGTTTTTNCDEWIPDGDTGEPPPYGDDVPVLTNTMRCRSANWIAEEMVRIMRLLAMVGDTERTVASVVSTLVTIFTSGEGFIWTMGALVALAYRLIEVSVVDTWQVYEGVADTLEGTMGEFVCALYLWANGEGLRDAIMGYVNGVLDGMVVGGSATTGQILAVRDVVGRVLNPVFINNIVDNINTIVPATFVAQYDCSCFEGEPSQYTISLGAGDAIGWVSGEVLEPGKAYTLQGSGSSVIRHNTAYAEVSVKALNGDDAAAILQVTAVNDVQVCDDAASNIDHSFWAFDDDATCMLDSGFAFVPSAGHVTPYLTMLKTKGTPDETYSFTFRVLAVRAKLCAE